MRRLPPGWMQPSFRARSFLPDSTVQIAAASATARLHLNISKRAKKKPRYPVRVGAGFLGSGVDNRAEYPLQHAMRAEPADGWNGHEVYHGVRRPLRQFCNGTRHAASRDYLVFGSLMLRNWRVASTTDFSIGNRSADEPPT